MSEHSLNSSSDGDQTSETKKKPTHRRMVSFPTLDVFMAKGKQLISPARETYSLEDAERANLDPLTPSLSQHRRNRSDPLTSSSLDDLSPETVDDESSVVTRRSLHEDRTESPQRRSLQLSSSRKKKSWYNPFQSTYAERQEELHKLFKDLPADERLLADYACAWQKDILVQGRMYVSTSSVCFYANLFSWKTSLVLKFTEIVGISQEKTAKVIPNAIELKSSKGEKYFFASFLTRDKTFLLLNRLWESTGKNELSSKQYAMIVQENYSEDCDMTENEDEGEEMTPTVQMEDKVESIPSDSSSVVPPPPTSEETMPVARFPYLSQCLCQKHYSSQFIDRTFPISIERLFEYIFGDGPFNASYRQARRMKEYRSEPWQVKNKRERLLNYTVTVNSPLGTKTVITKEKQIVDCEVSRSHFIVESEIRNEGVPYADTFCVLSRFCLIQIGPNRCNLKITSEVKFVKSIIGFMKSMIEKNTINALHESYNDLVKRIDEDPNRSTETGEDPPEISADVSPPTPMIQSADENPSPIETNLLVNALPVHSSSHHYFVQFTVIILTLLFLFNIYLCVKLNRIDQMTSQLLQTSPSWLKAELPVEKETDHWSLLFRQQEEYYQHQLDGLQSVLTSTHHALRNVTETLNRLSNRSM